MDIKDILNKINESISIYRSIFIPRTKEEAEIIMKHLENDDYSCRRQVNGDDFRVIIQTYDELSFNLDNNRLNINMSDISIIYTTDTENINNISDIISQFDIKYCYIINTTI